MADFSMWGAEASPDRLRQQDDQKAALIMSQIGHNQALARTENAQAAAREAEAAGEKRMAEALQARYSGKQIGGGLNGQTDVDSTPRSLASPIEDMSQMAFASGLPTKGAKLAEQAALVRAREASAGFRAAQQDKSELEAQHERMTHVSRLYSSVGDQASLERANALYAGTFQEPSPLAGMRYSPEMIQQIRDYSTTERQKVQNRLDQIRTSAYVANQNSAVDFRNARKPLIEAQTELAKAREERLGKIGGKDKGPGIPTANERRAASRLIESEFPGLPQDERNLASDKVSATARELMKNDKNLNADQAMRQALETNKADFKQVESGYLFFKSTKPTFKPGSGEKAAAPIALPTSKSDLKNGQVYQTAKGPLQWNGSRLVPTGKQVPASIPASQDLNNDGVDDDEE